MGRIIPREREGGARGGADTLCLSTQWLQSSTLHSYQLSLSPSSSHTRQRQVAWQPGGRGGGGHSNMHRTAIQVRSICLFPFCSHYAAYRPSLSLVQAACTKLIRPLLQSPPPPKEIAGRQPERRGRGGGEGRQRQKPN